MLGIGGAAKPAPSLLKQKKGNTQPNLLRSCGSPILEYVVVPLIHQAPVHSYYYVLQNITP